MSFDEKQLARTLVEAELMTQDQVERAQTVAKEHGWQLDEAIVREDYLSDEHLGQVIADLVGFPYVNLTRTNVDDHVMRIIPEIVAKNLMLFAYQRDQDGVRVAMADPDNIELQQLIHKRIGEPLHISFATPTDIRNALHHYRKGLKQEFG